MKKRILFAVIFILACLEAKPQLQKWQIGVEGGPNITDQGSGGVTTGFTGFFSTLGLVGQYNLNGIFSIKGGLTYETKGMYSSNTISDSISSNHGTFTTTEPLNYVVVPLFVKMGFGKKVRMYFEAGPYFGFLLDAKYITVLHYNTGENRTISDNVKNQYKPLDIGANLGIGVDIPVFKRFLINVEIRYSGGMYNISTDPNHINAQTQNIAFAGLLGLSYKL